MKLHFNRTYNIDKDAVSFIFTVEGNEKPNHGNGTLVALVPIENNQEFDDPFIWTAKIESIEGDVMSVLIKPSATCPVTKWKLDVDTKLINGLSKTYPVTEKIYVLFNPWCVHDQVFMLGEYKDWPVVDIQHFKFYISSLQTKMNEMNMSWETLP